MAFYSIEELYQIYLKHPSVQTDSRKVKPNDIFFALKGPNFNGNAFAPQALQAGASYAVVDEPASTSDERLIQVENVLTTLQQLAAFHRRQFQIPFIAITGSNGKTTTKELVHAVLSSTFITYATQGNLNNHIGIPLTILSIPKTAQFAVIEMGANHLNEIAGYCAIAQPTHGIITNCGSAHIEGFGSIEGVRKGKGELYDYLRKHNGTAFVCSNYDYLREMSKGIKEIFWYGTEEGNVVGKADVHSAFLFLKVIFSKGFSLSIQTKLIGNYNLPNVLAAVAVGKYFNVPEHSIQAAIENYNPSNNRSQLLHIGSNVIIMDAYNANPSSMQAAIENFAALNNTSPKILLLGAMMELGSESEREHQKLVELIKKYNWKEVILVGGHFEKAHGNYYYFPTVEAAAEWLKTQHIEQSFILIKGSRSIQMEKILEACKNDVKIKSV